MIFRHRLPVLWRELAQIASRKSTYVLRLLFAIAVCGLGLLFARDCMVREASRRIAGDVQTAAGMLVSGAGRDLLESVVHLALVLTGLLLPALVVGSVTTERENGTLELMLVSRLSRSEIVMQKFFARMVPFCGFLLMLVPLAALAYSLGGVSVGNLAAAAALVLFGVVRVVAVSLLCSACCRSTVSAFTAAYLTIGAIFVLPAWMMQTVLWRWVAPEVMLHVTRWVYGPWTPRGGSHWRYLHSQLGYVLLLTLGLWAVLASASRMMGRPQRRRLSVVRRLHRRFDRLMARMNRVTGGLRWGQAGSGLPDARPVAWRERARSALWAPEHIFRNFFIVSLVTITALVVAIPAWGWLADSGRPIPGISVCIGVLWIPALLLPALYSANLISRERAEGSLDVLFTTLLTPRDFLKQKLGAAPKLLLLCIWPMVILAGFQVFYGYGSEGVATQRNAYCGLTLGAFFIFPWLAVWIAMTCSLLVRRRSIVVLMTLIWCLVAFGGQLFVGLLLLEYAPLSSKVAETILWASPVGTWAMAGWGLASRSERDYLEVTYQGLAFYALLAVGLRWWCYSCAERVLRK